MSPDADVPASAARRWSDRLFGRRRRLAAGVLSVTSEDGEPRYRPIDRRMILRLAGRLKPYRKHYALGLVLGLVMVVLEMLSPTFMGAIINLASGYAAGTLRPMPSEQAAVARLAGLVGLWGLVLAAALVLHRWTIRIMVDAGERVQFDLRRELFAHLQRLSMSFYDRTRLGRIISRCTSDINSLREINVWGLDLVLKNALVTVVAAGMLYRTEPRLFLSVVWLAPVLFVLNRAYRRRAAVLQQQVREGFTRVSTNLAENITGVRVVTAFDRQVWNLGAFNTLQHRNTANNLEAARLTGVYQPLLSLVGFAGRAIILLYGGYLVAAGRIDRAVGVGSVVAAFLYWDWFMVPVVNFGNFYGQLMMAMAGAERVFSLLDTEPEVRDLPGARPLPPVRGHVRFEHVTFGYDPARPVLHDIDFEVRPGQMVALVGPTGSGKSSIISLIARFYQPQQGRVLVDGHDIREVTAESLHRQTGLVLQSNYLFSGTVMDNIRYVRPQATDEQIAQAARALGTYEAIMSLKEGFHTPVGERGANLSLGQRQLVCFTRAFVADPRIFLLDEATSAIDTATEQVVQRSLERLLRGRTTFVVAHRLSTIQRADLILVIEAGRIVERGTHWELLELAGRYADLYQQFACAAD